MKLEKFLLGCTPLPWKHFESNATGNNRRYSRHAANSLPELVIAARQFRASVLRNGQVGQEMILRLQNALVAAEEVTPQIL